VEIVLPQCCHAFCKLCYEKLSVKSKLECPECETKVYSQYKTIRDLTFELLDPNEGNIDIEIQEKITNGIAFILN
jgi:hypothetical protein